MSLIDLGTHDVVFTPSAEAIAFLKIEPLNQPRTAGHLQMYPHLFLHSESVALHSWAEERCITSSYDPNQRDADGITGIRIIERAVFLDVCNELQRFGPIEQLVPLLMKENGAQRKNYLDRVEDCKRFIVECKLAEIKRVASQYFVTPHPFNGVTTHAQILFGTGLCIAKWDNRRRGMAMNKYRAEFEAEEAKPIREALKAQSFIQLNIAMESLSFEEGSQILLKLAKIGIIRLKEDETPIQRG